VCEDNGVIVFESGRSKFEHEESSLGDSAVYSGKIPFAALRFGRLNLNMCLKRELKFSCEDCEFSSWEFRE